jgi:ATP-dependent Clp protease protease subunit
MIHQPSGGARGQASDIEIHAREILFVRQRLNEIFARHTGQEIAVVEESMERDTFMTPEQAKAFGLIDQVVASRSETAMSDGPDGADEGGKRSS